MFGGLSPWIATPLGFALLWLGAEGLVRGASRLASSLGISKIVIGLTLVAFGTSLPEMLVCLTAAVRGTPDIAVGNVVGSNIANIGLIVGVAALLSPIAVGRRLLSRDLPWAVLSALLVAGFALSGQISRPAGVIMLGLFAVYMAQLFRTETRGGDVEPEGHDHLTPASTVLEAVMALVGLAMLIVGAPLLVEGATAIARAVGISELVIGLTMVAVGTSLPELATAVVAGKRGHADLILGNVIGSNIFNILLVLATTAAILPVRVVPVALHQDIPIMTGLSLLLLALCCTGRRITRAEGGVFLTLYSGYAVWLFLRGV